MKFLHYKLHLSSDDIVEVTLNKQANVRLLDSTNFARYRKGRRYTYHGGLVKASPFCLSPPHAGRWHLVIDLGRYAGTVKASVRTIRGQDY